MLPASHRHFSLALALLLAACERSEALPVTASGPAEPPAFTSSGLPPLLAPYPLGRWRLGDRGALENVVVWTSHILIRFDKAKTDEVNFTLTSWRSVAPPPTRTRAEALVLAQDIARRARSEPKTFAALAARYSEDITTKDQGGSLGGVTASQLTLWPQVVDALAAIAPGEVSEVVETWYGFHVFSRSAPVPEQRVSGAHVVIGHELAPWLAVVARGPVPARSREQAAALAQEVYAQARRDPQRFGELVERYSEHRTATAGGDFGSYSTREPNDFPRHVEVLSHLQSGEVAPPIETPVGFEIIQRTPERPRQLYAMNSLWLPFDPEAPDADPSSRASVLAVAKAHLVEIASDPQRFDAIQKTVCCTYVQQWVDGRGTPALTSMLERLRPGQMAPEPVESESYQVIAQRIEPAPEPTIAPSFELPAQEEVNLEYHLAMMQPASSEALLRRAGERAEAELALDPTALEAYQSAHQISGQINESSLAEARVALLDGLLANLRHVLDDQQFATYLAVLQREFRAYLLDPANETAISRLGAGF
jgi:hypothetical protein